MTFVRKFSGDRTSPIIAVYTCPEHGEFDAEVARDENGEAPDTTWCGAVLDAPREGVCMRPSTWTPSPSVGCRIRRIEVVRGGWERPERKTYLDTRRLGEGQDIEEFRAERKKIWDEKRKQDVMDYKKGF